MILDTSFVIDVMNSDDDALNAYQVYENSREQQYLSAQTVYELYFGVERAMHSVAERRRVRDVVDTKAVLPADRAVMKKAGRIRGRLMNDGQAIDPGDCVIAATALVEEEPVVMRNVDHFDRIEALELRTY